MVTKLETAWSPPLWPFDALQASEPGRQRGFHDGHQRLVELMVEALEPRFLWG